jgi:hypothetical protein
MIKEVVESEDDRMRLRKRINAQQKDVSGWKEQYKVVYSNEEFKEKFTVRRWLAPYVFVTDRVTGDLDVLYFQHMPRVYFSEDAPPKLTDWFKE